MSSTFHGTIDELASLIVINEDKIKEIKESVRREFRSLKLHSN